MQPKHKRREDANKHKHETKSIKQANAQSNPKQGHGLQNLKKQTGQANICYGMWWWFRHSLFKTQGNVVLELYFTLTSIWDLASLLTFILFTPMENPAYDDSRVIENGTGPKVTISRSSTAAPSRASKTQPPIQAGFSRRVNWPAQTALVFSSLCNRCLITLMEKRVNTGSFSLLWKASFNFSGLACVYQGATEVWQQTNHNHSESG